MDTLRAAYFLLACLVWPICSVTCGPASDQPRKIVIDFDTVDGSTVDAAHDVVAAAAYLQRFKITLSDVTPGSRVVIVSAMQMYEGRSLKAVSGNNVLTQIDKNDPVSFTLNFAEPMQSVEFTRPALVAGVTGITFPEWKAQAIDKNGKNIGAPAGEPLGKGYDYYRDVPARTFTLNGPGIQGVRFSSNNYHFAAFSAVVIDDLTLSPEHP
jgi:hypothetical protein